MTILRFFAVSALLAVSAALGNMDWGYERHNGPDSWTETCASGRRQSPIDIHAANVDYSLITKMHFANYIKTGNVSIKNNGHSVMISGFADWGENQPYIYGGDLETKYQLIQIHFHWGPTNDVGSEHSIGTLHYPIEVHLVHQKDGTKDLTVLPGDGLAVLAVFGYVAQESIHFNTIEPILNNIVAHGSEQAYDKYQPKEFLPVNAENFYRYDGSLTTPSCGEQVVWTIFAEPLPITQKQLTLFRKIQSSHGTTFDIGNFRHAQPLNGRRIKYRGGSDRHQICGHNSANKAAGGLTVISVVIFIFSAFY
uniref:Carbonic anhydrase n=1 Tax=Bursaphelenchus xylophilus TaxID=6326 RepID=A0A1I7RJC6_BURXY